MAQFKGQYIVISDALEVTGFEDRLQAYTFGAKTYGSGNFMLQECFEGNDFVRECLETFDENVLEIDACLMQIQRMQ